MNKQKSLDELFGGRHFDREIIIFPLLGVHNAVPLHCLKRAREVGLSPSRRLGQLRQRCRVRLRDQREQRLSSGAFKKPYPPVPQNSNGRPMPIPWPLPPCCWARARWVIGWAREACSPAALRCL